MEKLPSRKIVTQSPSSTTPLASDKESKVFPLYVLYGDIIQVASIIEVPLDVVKTTAERFNWEERKQALMETKGASGLVTDVQKDLANTLLMATAVFYKKELGDLIMGRDKASDRLIPKSMQALSALMEMVASLNGLGGKVETPIRGTVVNAQNVQINQSVGTDQNDTNSRLSVLKKLNASKE